MSLKTQLMDDMKQAMRDRDSDKLGTIRFLMSEIKNAEIDGASTDDAGLIKIISKQVKQMKDAISEFEKAGRNDLVEEESKKVAVLEAYLPEQLSDDEVEAIVKEVLAGMDNPNMGAAIGAVRAKIGDQADGGTIARFVKASL